MLVVLLLLHLSLAMDDGDFNHGGGGGGGGSPAAAAAVAGAAVDNDWRQKQLAMRVLMVARWRARKQMADNATTNQIRE
jgi:hypothetical protein